MTKFILSRLAAIPITFLIVTATLYAIVMLASPEERAGLYWPPRTRQDLPPETAQRLLERIIADHGLRDPYPIQYVRWLANLLQGDWGYSPALNDDVLRALLRRTPVTLELTLYSLLTYIPIGLSSGLLAGWRYHSRIDNGFRLLAFFATAIVPFVPLWSSTWPYGS